MVRSGIEHVHTHACTCAQVVRRWAALSIGDNHAAGVSGDGECYTWGGNDLGQLGIAPGEARDVPQKMDILRGWDVRAIACGCARTGPQQQQSMPCSVGPLHTPNE